MDKEEQQRLLAWVKHAIDLLDEDDLDEFEEEMNDCFDNFQYFVDTYYLGE